MASIKQQNVADELIREFETEIGLEPVDAHRSAFTALAVRRGWTNARIGRYLGISRARVGQRVEKLEHYVATKDVPVLAKVMSRLAAPVRSDLDHVVQFQIADWEDLEFARRMVERVI